MNRPGHVLNAVLLSVGLAYLVEPMSLEALDVPLFVRNAVVIGIPVTLGALFPDIDCAFGTHRKTFHNLLVLGTFMAFPYFTGNLQFVWIGVLTHYVLDTLGTVRGMAYFYPWPKEYDLPVVAPLSSYSTTAAIVAVTAIELVVAAAVLHLVPLGLFEAALRFAGL